VEREEREKEREKEREREREKERESYTRQSALLAYTCSCWPVLRLIPCSGTNIYQAKFFVSSIHRV
jgi:hypothetical protein